MADVLESTQTNANKQCTITSSANKLKYLSLVFQGSDELRLFMVVHWEGLATASPVVPWNVSEGLG